VVYVYNPDSEDFSTTYDVNGNGDPVTFTIRSFEIGKFEIDAVGKHMLKHLADKILMKRKVKTNWANEHDALMKELNVTSQTENI